MDRTVYTAVNIKPVSTRKQKLRGYNSGNHKALDKVL